MTSTHVSIINMHAIGMFVFVLEKHFYCGPHTFQHIASWDLTFTSWHVFLFFSK